MPAQHFVKLKNREAGVRSSNQGYITQSGAYEIIDFYRADGQGRKYFSLPGNCSTAYPQLRLNNRVVKRTCPVTVTGVMG